jgi:hypothetical protein
MDNILSINNLIDNFDKFIPSQKDLVKGILITKLFNEGIYIGQEEDGKYIFINNNTWLQVKDQIETVINNNPLSGIIGIAGIPIYEDEPLVYKFILEHQPKELNKGTLL